MLCAERLCELPLEVRILVARLDAEAYTRMWVYDDEFRCYANGEYAIDDFIERFVITRMTFYIFYKINNIEYYKYDNGRQFWYKHSKLHRINGPAIICPNSDMFWYNNGELHRIDGPAILDADGSQSYYINGKLHRMNGPAHLRADGSQSYYINGELHRDDGPAVIHANGDQEYWINGVRRRIDRHATINANGDQLYYINNKLHCEGRLSIR